MSAPETHVYLSNISMPNQNIYFRDDLDHNHMVADDVVLQNVVAKRAQRGSYYDYGLPTGVYLRNSHIRKEHRIFESDERVNNLSVGELDFELVEGSGWVYSGPGAPMLVGTGIPIPGFLVEPVDKGFIP